MYNPHGTCLRLEVAPEQKKCALRPRDHHGRHIFQTRRGCITPAMNTLFHPCTFSDCDGCPVVEKELRDGGLLHQPVREIGEIADRLMAAEYTLVEINGKHSKHDAERIEKALHFIRDSIVHLRSHQHPAPNNPMQATGLRPSGADEQSLSSDSSGEGCGSNPPRA